jgi:hypothetical protein
MNRSQLWGFEVSHVIISFAVLAGSNVMLNIAGLPLLISWGLGLSTLALLRIVSHGQKNGHLELLVKFWLEPHIFLGHRNRSKRKL